MHRRTVLAGLGSVALAGLAGCQGLRESLTEHEASPVRVAAATREETGYAETGVESVVVSETVGVDSVSEDVVVTNYLTEHEKSIDMGPLGRRRGAVFVVLSTPRITVAGRSVNPVADKTTAELVELVQDNYDGLTVDRREADGTVTIAGQRTTQSRFAARARFDGTEVDVSLHVSEAVEFGDDLVVTIGVYPREFGSREAENVIALMEGVGATDDANEDTDGGADDDRSVADVLPSLDGYDPRERTVDSAGRSLKSDGAL